jgi:predicted phage tail protein
MVNVILRGQIGRKFRGDQPDGSWMLNVSTPREAIHAIEANIGGIFKYLIKATEKGIDYRVILDGQDIDHIDQIHVPIQDYDTIEIIPVIIGEASSGFWQVVAGVVLILAGVVIGIYAGWTGIGAVIAKGAIGYGIGLVIGGLVNLLLPANTTGSKGRNAPSYLFSGQVNGTRQGEGVPICYGELITGSQLVSAYLTTAEIDKNGNIISQMPTNPNPIPTDIYRGPSNPFGGQPDPEIVRGAGGKLGDPLPSLQDRRLPSSLSDESFDPVPTVRPVDDYANVQ